MPKAYTSAAVDVVYLKSSSPASEASGGSIISGAAHRLDPAMFAVVKSDCETTRYSLVSEIHALPSFEIRTFDWRQKA